MSVKTKVITVIKPIEKNTFEEYNALSSKLQGLAQSIRERITYILEVCLPYLNRKPIGAGFRTGEYNNKDLFEIISWDIILPYFECKQIDYEKENINPEGGFMYKGREEFFFEGFPTEWLFTDFEEDFKKGVEEFEKINYEAELKAKKEKEEAKKKKAELKKQAALKLTTEERKALGIKEK